MSIKKKSNKGQNQKFNRQLPEESVKAIKNVASW